MSLRCLLFGIFVTAFSSVINADAVQQQTPVITPFKAVSAMASNGNPKYQACLGDMYKDGWGVQRDYDQAFTWYKRAAKNGNIEGQISVGWMYLDGTGTPYDRHKALEIFYKLIDKGYSVAAFPIGWIYYYGVGVPQNYSVAFSWYEKAAAGGDPFAEVALAIMYTKGLGIKPNIVKARQWLQKIAAAKFVCPPDFSNISASIVYANVKFPKAKQLVVKPTGKPIIYHFGIIDGKAINPVVVQTSGSPALDAAFVQAIKQSTFPAWPDLIQGFDRVATFYMVRNPLESKIYLDEGFSEKIVAAIDHAVIVPKHTLLYGSTGTDVVTVSFEYMNGIVKHVKVKYSSKDIYEDAAVIKGVKGAKYPKTPPTYANKVLHLSMTYSFAAYLPVASTAVTQAPTAATTH